MRGKDLEEWLSAISEQWSVERSNTIFPNGKCSSPAASEPTLQAAAIFRLGRPKGVSPTTIDVLIAANCDRASRLRVHSRQGFFSNCALDGTPAVFAARTLSPWERDKLEKLRAKPNPQAAALVLLVRRYPDTLAAGKGGGRLMRREFGK